MRAPLEIQATVTAEQVKIQDDRLILQAQLRLELPLPEQDAELPGRLEAGIERGGQVLKRRLFQQAVEQADAELILARRHGKDGQGIICRGTTPFTFKTVFGTVQVRRRRIEHHADGTTEVPSAHAWQTPRQVAITPGLRHAACDGMLRDSAQQVVARIDTRAGEDGRAGQDDRPGDRPRRGAAAPGRGPRPRRGRLRPRPRGPAVAGPRDHSRPNRTPSPAIPTTARTRRRRRPRRR